MAAKSTPWPRSMSSPEFQQIFEAIENPHLYASRNDYAHLACSAAGDSVVRISSRCKRNIEFSIPRPYNSFRAERQKFIFL
jgi:hypothetical protein